jgi:hypothetical protein
MWVEPHPASDLSVRSVLCSARARTFSGGTRMLNRQTTANVGCCGRHHTKPPKVVHSFRRAERFGFPVAEKWNGKPG